jgi:hypothetical protein
VRYLILATHGVLTKERLDLIALYIHAQNAAIVIRKEEHSTRFEIFEVQTPTTDVMACSGKLLRTFPGPAIDVPAAHAADDGFLGHVSNIFFYKHLFPHLTRVVAGAYARRP